MQLTSNGIPTDKYMQLRLVSVNQVLGTDMKKHFDITSRFQVGHNLILAHSVHMTLAQLYTSVQMTSVQLYATVCMTLGQLHASTAIELPKSRRWAEQQN